MKVIHHGGKNTVTGSCHELFFAEKNSILVDCGLFQGCDKQSLAVSFPINNINAAVITHAHVDHIGRIPWLLAAGYKGPIYCTAATAELIPLMIEDGLKIQLGFNQQQINSILTVLRKRIRPVVYGQWERVSSYRSSDYCYVRFSPAGHILGSAIVEVKCANNEVVVFSGDLGPTNTPLLPDPVPPKRADYLFIESTYANKQHEDITLRKNRLGEVIERSLKDGGTIVIPAFSVGRTQEILFDIEQLIFDLDVATNIPIILDSPMALKVTKSYRRYRKLWSQEAKCKLRNQRHPLAFEQCVKVDSYRMHQRLVNRLASTGEPAIVIAASGMCEGGRIMSYLKALLPDERTDVVFVGYQAEGTLGRKLQSGSLDVVIDEVEVKVNAQIHIISGYSAHADSDDLLRFVKGIEERPKEVHLIHGEVNEKATFASSLRKEGFDVVE